MLLHLPEGRDARLAGQAMRQAITALPARLAGTITWDQGIEMTYLADFTIATWPCQPQLAPRFSGGF